MDRRTEDEKEMKALPRDPKEDARARRDPEEDARANSRQGMEMVLFVVTSVIGIYAFGKGTTGLIEPGGGFNALWLAVAGVTFLVLFRQMGRVHDTWPRRRGRARSPRLNGKAVRGDQAPSARNSKMGSGQGT